MQSAPLHLYSSTTGPNLLSLKPQQASMGQSPKDTSFLAISAMFDKIDHFLFLKTLFIWPFPRMPGFPGFSGHSCSVSLVGLRFFILPVNAREVSQAFILVLFSLCILSLHNLLHSLDFKYHLCWQLPVSRHLLQAWIYPDLSGYTHSYMPS